MPTLSNKLTFLILLFSLHLNAQDDWERFPIMQGLAFYDDFKGADIDNDGDQDIVAVTDAFVVWFENLDGQGKFGLQTYLADIGNSFLFLEDLDNDGDIDIVVRGGFLENLGNGAFGSLTSLFAANVVVRDIADYNGDGYVDIVAGSNSLDLYLNNQNNTFSSLANFFEAQQVFSYYTFVDVDQDGDRDIILSSSLGLSLYKNDGGTFSEVIISTTEKSYTNYGDFDQDGDIDIVAVGNSVNKVYIFENLGNDDWDIEELTETSQAISYVEVADVDNDNDLDIVFDRGDGAVVWYRNLAGSFNTVQVAHPTSILKMIKTKAIDLTGTGNLDFVGYHNSPYIGCPRLSWYQNFGSSFSENKQVAFNVVDGLMGIAMADLDNDGDQDFVLDNDGLRWSENLGDGVFCPGATLSKKTLSRQVVIADWGGDGDQDIFGTVSSSMAGWWVNNGSGNFTPLALHPLPSGSGSLSADHGDLDNDGDADLVMAVSGSPEFRMLWYEQSNSNGFVEHDISYASGVEFLKLSDYDQDGDLDIVLLYRDSRKIRVAENIGDVDSPEFAALEVLVEELPSRVNSFEVQDLNGDGKEDLFMSNSPTSGSSTLSYYLNNGGGWDAKEDIASFASTGSTIYTFSSLADMDLDGDLDALFGTALGNEMGLYVNDGAANFTFQNSILSVPSGVTAVANVAAVDIDGDLMPDPFCYYYHEGQGGGIANDAIDEIFWFKNPFSFTPNYSIDVRNVVCNDAGTDTMAEDDFIQFEVTIAAPNLEGTYEIEVDGFAVSPSLGTYGAEIFLELEAGSAGNGNRLITITDSENPNFVTSFEVADPGTCSLTSAIESIDDGLRINLFPNPVQQTLRFSVEGLENTSNYFVRLLTTRGKEVLNAPLGSTKQLNMHTATLPSGMYFYQLVNEGGKIIKTGRVIKL